MPLRDHQKAANVPTADTDETRAPGVSVVKEKTKAQRDAAAVMLSLVFRKLVLFYNRATSIWHFQRCDTSTRAAPTSNAFDSWPQRGRFKVSSSLAGQHKQQQQSQENSRPSSQNLPTEEKPEPTTRNIRKTHNSRFVM